MAQRLQGYAELNNFFKVCKLESKQHVSSKSIRDHGVMFSQECQSERSQIRAFLMYQPVRELQGRVHAWERRGERYPPRTTHKLIRFIRPLERCAQPPGTALTSTEKINWTRNSFISQLLVSDVTHRTSSILSH